MYTLRIYAKVFISQSTKVQKELSPGTKAQFHAKAQMDEPNQIIT